ncbi:hypothetical protein ACFV1W_14900 [Kitasatospora sp. NPDC059648]
MNHPGHPADDYSYSEQGASRTGDLPAGYRRLRHRARIGHNPPWTGG